MEEGDSTRELARAMWKAITPDTVNSAAMTPEDWRAIAERVEGNLLDRGYVLVDVSDELPV